MAVIVRVITGVVRIVVGNGGAHGIGSVTVGGRSGQEGGDVEAGWETSARQGAFKARWGIRLNTQPVLADHEAQR